MARATGKADLPLHGGHVPAWLADRMSALGRVMAEAIVRRMDWSAELGLKQRFGAEAPKSYREVLDALAKMSSAAD